MAFYFFKRWLAGACLATALLPGVGRAQTATPAPVPGAAGGEAPTRCATDAAMRRRLGTGYDAWWQAYRTRLQTRDAALRATAGRVAATPPAGPRFVLPVVVHIIHDGPGSDIPDEQVYDAIRILNEDYQARNADTAAVLPYFKPRVGNTNVEFRLARRDPQGGCTNGITRTYSPLTNSADDNVKQLIAWDRARYLNVWVVRNISFGAAGYAYLPCWGGADDGIVILNGYIGSVGRGNPRNSRALTHEVGHYLGLPHTWGGTNNPGPGNGNCADDDGVTDTPNTEGSDAGNCNPAMPACPNSGELLSNVQNQMDYSYCSVMFTTGQAALMNDGIATDFACRAALASPANLQVTGVADGLNLPPCAPLVAFAPASALTAFDLRAARACAGDSVRLRALVTNLPANAPVQYAWSFPGGAPATSTRPLPAVVYAAPGQYAVTLTVTSGGASTTLTTADFVRIAPTAGGLAAPLITSFEEPQFPLDPTDPLKNWEIVTTGPAPTWEYTAAAAALGTGAVRIVLRTNNGDEHLLISPTVVFPTALANAELHFRVAYAQRNSSTVDVLRVAYSADCGQTWITRFVRRGAGLAAGNPLRGTAPFVPIAADWHDFTLPLGNLRAGDHRLLRFAATGDLGNALYLDDLRVTGAPVVTGFSAAEAPPAADLLVVVPNPTAAPHGTVRLNLPAAGGPATLRAYDGTGRLLAPAYHCENPGATPFELPLTRLTGTRARGLYLLELTTASGLRRTVRGVIE